MVTDWINEDDSNRHYFEHFKLIWDTSKQLAVVSTADENKAWERFQYRVKNDRKKTKPGKIRNISLLRIAASILLLVAIGLVTFFLLNTNKPKELIVQTFKNVLTDTLSDGSVVTLNKESSLSYPSSFKGDKRMVTLKGEAFFKITPDKKKPFNITINDIQIEVVGTSFNVKGKNGKTEVVVETGIVRVTKDGNSIELKAGEKTKIAEADSSMSKEEVSDKLYNYYRTKEFVCDNTPLWKLVDVLNDAYNAHIVIGRKELRDLPLTSPFYNESLDQVLQVISLTFNITVIKKDGQIILE